MGLISNSIDRAKLKVGDHIYCYRMLHSYSHHGIYVDDNRVIHYTKTESEGEPSSDQEAKGCGCGYRPKEQRGVVKSCLDCFLKGHHRAFRFEYGVSESHFYAKKVGTCSLNPCDNPDTVVQRAIQMLDGHSFGKYDFLNNNCESFAVYCKTGKSSSAQALSAKTKATIFFKNITEKPFNLENLASAAAEAAFSYKINVVKQHVLEVGRQQQSKGILMSSSSGQQEAEEMDIAQ